MTLTVLMSMIGARTSHSLLEAIKNNGDQSIELIGVDPVSPVPGQFTIDEFEKVRASYRNESGYIEDVNRILDTYDVDVMLPCGNEDSLAVAKHKEQLERTGAVIAVSEYEALKTAFDKYQMYNVVSAEAPEAAPEFYLVHNYDEFRQRASDLGYPANRFVMKPRLGRGGRGVIVVEPEFDFDEFLTTKPTRTFSFDMIDAQLQSIDDFPELILMEYLPGDVLSSYSYCEDGDTVVTLAHRRLWGTASNTLKSRIERPTDINRTVAKINSSFGFEHNINYEFALDDEGIARVFDLNPRLAASTAVFRCVGVNFPYLSVRSAMGQEVSVPDAFDGINETIMMRHLTEMYLNERTGDTFEL